MPFPTSSYARAGRFQEIYPVGSGAAGQVYHAVDNLGRHVAVKEALPAAEGFAALRAKFEKEARLQAQLDHPNIVRVYHLEQDPETGELYLICEYADGGSLADLIERAGPLPEAQAIQIAVDICAALEETERLRIVHRDVKPSNILLFRRPDGRLSAKLSDFGIAQDARQRRTTMLPGTSHPGTPLYMAPEQADATLLVDTRADIFALGVTLWEMLTRADYKALLRDDGGPMLTVYSPASSAALGQVITRAARSDRELRYQAPRDLAADLRRLLAREPLAPETSRIALPARRDQGRPVSFLGALAPLAVTFALLVGVWLATALFTRIFGPTAVQGPGAPELSASVVPIATASPLAAAALDPRPPTAVPPGSAGCVSGSRRSASASRPVEQFSDLQINTIGQVEVRQGAAPSLTVTADDNILPLVSAAVRDGSLVLDLAGCVGEMGELRYVVTVPDLESLTIAGVADVQIASIRADALALRISGTGTIEASGDVGRLEVQIDGAGEVRGQPLTSVAAEVQISGHGTVMVSAQDSLAVDIAGTGTVVYFGSPAITQSISGVGSVQGLGPP